MSEEEEVVVFGGCYGLVWGDKAREIKKKKKIVRGFRRYVSLAHLRGVAQLVRTEQSS